MLLELPHGKSLNLGSPIPIMGIVNVTPDSFSDGGVYATRDAAIEHGVSLAAQGAAILDIGGESTRPGHVAVAADQELSRVIPVIAGLHGRVAAPISVDTMKARVAAAAIEAGASIVNDVWGLQYDREMARVVADTGAGVVLMHNRTSIDPELDIVADILAFLARSIEIALAAGVERRRILIDPGFGFGKTKAQNLEAIRRLRELTVLGCPILLGVSLQVDFRGRDRPEDPGGANGGFDRRRHRRRRQRRGGLKGSRRGRACRGHAGAERDRGRAAGLERELNVASGPVVEASLGLGGYIGDVAGSFIHALRSLCDAPEVACGARRRSI